MNRLPLFALLLLGAFTAAQAQAPQGVPTPGPTLPAPNAQKAQAAKPGTFREINWDELVPKDWDPMKEFKDLQLGGLSDADPRATQLLKRMREAWDNAPSNPALDGKAVRIPGYVVPLEETKDGLKEFLLVPYFGACIHSPPPPANQIIHVLPQSVPKGIRSMDPVWISGTLVRGKVDSYMGAAAYKMEARLVEPYVERTR
jgi:hypothetical protein